MKKIILLLLFISYNAFSQTDIYGMWGTVDGEYVEIFPDNTFKRYNLRGLNKRKEILAEGYIEYDGERLEVYRTDTVDTYDLDYFMGYENMVITKPRESEAWLWEKLYDY
jgi:hypothetical protein